MSVSDFETLEHMIEAAAADSLRPAERLTVSEAAEKYRYINNPGSYVGNWDNSVAPYLVEPMDSLTSLEFVGMIFAGPARCGKSDLFFNWLAQTAICDPADMMVIHMTQNTARDWSLGDLRKNFRASRQLGAKVASGRQNMNVHDIRFTSGMRLLVKWPTISELSGKTIPRIWLADYDRMSQDVDKEGSPYFLAKKRAQTFKRYGMTVAESSPGFQIDDPKWVPSTPHEAPPTQGVLSLYNRGDRRRWLWACIDCDGTYEPDFSNLSWPEDVDDMEAAEQAVMVCPHCGGFIHHDPVDGRPGKHIMNRDRGRWVPDNMIWDFKKDKLIGTPIRTDTASFWLKGPAAMFTDWKTIVYNFLKAEEDYQLTGGEESLKTTINVDQGLPYMPKAAKMERVPDELKSRATDLGEKVVPEGVRFLVSAIDVQKNRFVVQVHGIGIGGDITIVDRFEIKKSKRVDEDGERLWVNPGAYLEDWDLLIEEVIEMQYPLYDGSGFMRVKAVGCDSGGREGVTKNAYDFWRRLRDDPDGRDMYKRFILIKGVSNKTAPRTRIGYPDSDNKQRNAGARGEIPVLFINTDYLKDEVNNALARIDPFGGRINFPDWLADWFYNELTVERRTAKGWENPRKARNEAWDLLVYTRAVLLSRLVRMDVIDWDRPPSFAREWDDNDFVFSEAEIKRFEQKTKTKYTLAELAEQLG